MSFLCACFDILFDSSVSVVTFSFSFFPLHQEAAGRLFVMFLFFCPHICHEDWSASRHVEDMNLDVECPLRLRFFRRVDRKGKSCAFVDWSMAAILILPFCWNYLEVLLVRDTWAGRRSSLSVGGYVHATVCVLLGIRDVRSTTLFWSTTA